jgi:hypothetical protein
MHGRTPDDPGSWREDADSAARLFVEWVTMPIVLLRAGMEAMLVAFRNFPESPRRRVESVRAEPAVWRHQIVTDSSASHFAVEPHGLRRDVTTIHQDSKSPTITEETKMPDQNLSGEDLKLVRYKVLFVKRDYEYAFREQEELVYDDLRGEDFTSWKIAEFIQGLHKNDDDNENPNPDHVVPSKWMKKNYPGDDCVQKRSGTAYLTALPEADKKHLRLFYEVLQRYPREEFKHQERQIEVLEQIRDKIK